MFLNADEIKKTVADSDLHIVPFIDALLKPASYTIRLGNHFRRWRAGKVTLDPTTAIDANGALGAIESAEEIILQCGDFVLCSSLEAIGLSQSVLGWVTTLSHIARLGLSVTLNSHLVSPGFGLEHPTPLTLEVISWNPSPVTLRVGTPVCHLILSRIKPMRSTLPLERSVYSNLDVPSGPAMYQEYELAGLQGILPQRREEDF